MRSATVIDDADAVMVYFLGQNPQLITKNIVLLTLGTGAGSSALIGGRLVPNLELGFLGSQDGPLLYELLNAHALRAAETRGELESHFTSLVTWLVGEASKVVSLDTVVLAGQGSTMLPPEIENRTVQVIDPPVYAGALGAATITLGKSAIPLPIYDGMARRTLEGLRWKPATEF